MNKEQFFKKYEATNGGFSEGITYSYCEFTIDDRTFMFEIKESSLGVGSSHHLNIFCDKEDVEFLKEVGFDINEENQEVLDKNLVETVFGEYQTKFL